MTPQSSSSSPSEIVGGWQVAILAASIVTLVLLFMDTFMSLPAEMSRVVQFADVCVCVLFLADFAWCLKRAPNRWQYFYTWGWLDLLGSIPLMEPFRVGRVARILRILRLFRGVRATHRIFHHLTVGHTPGSLLGLSVIGLLIVFLGAKGILLMETAPNSNIRTAEDALWWSMVTIATVGYGDHFPVTTGGRLVASALMLIGIGWMGSFTALVAASLVRTGRSDPAEAEALRAEVRELRKRLGEE